MKNLIRKELGSKITEKEISLIPSSFDIVGNIMIFSDFPDALKKKEKMIGEAILKNFRHICTILKKTKKHSGKYRTPKLSFITGKKTKETIHKENGVMVKLNVEKAYFSSRLSNERKRIFIQVENGETILVMFSGIGIYPLAIAKNSGAKEVYGIEINPAAHGYALENLKLNKLENKIRLFKGDVKKIMPGIKKKFDRILMPLPKDAGNFLDLALNKIKPKGTIHLYEFSEEGNYTEIEEKIKNSCKKAKKKCEILEAVKCGHYSPRVFRMCFDIKVG
ncbi:class I SAM-dependent methyltransferase family protein [Candidatus Woesearchaeota archaeon]|nr:class I SAM-dependent methyltransferase family protein [Candidatus Woesearchaeota archaeon]